MSNPIQFFLDLVPGRRRSQDANSIVESLPSSPDWDTSCGRLVIRCSWGWVFFLREICIPCEGEEGHRPDAFASEWDVLHGTQTLLGGLLGEDARRHDDQVGTDERHSELNGARASHRYGSYLWQRYERTRPRCVTPRSQTIFYPHQVLFHSYPPFARRSRQGLRRRGHRRSFATFSRDFPATPRSRIPYRERIIRMNARMCVMRSAGPRTTRTRAAGRDEQNPCVIVDRARSPRAPHALAPSRPFHGPPTHWPTCSPSIGRCQRPDVAGSRAAMSRAVARVT